MVAGETNDVEEGGRFWFVGEEREVGEMRGVELDEMGEVKFQEGGSVYKYGVFCKMASGEEVGKDVGVCSFRLC